MNYRITELFAFVAVDHDGDEGVIGFRHPSGDWLPLVGADMERIESLKPFAMKTAAASGKPVKLLRFKVREEIETLEVPK